MKKEFDGSEQTTASLVIYCIIICTIPHAPCVVVIGILVLLMIFWNNYFQTKIFFLPSAIGCFRVCVKRVLLSQLSISVLFGIVYQLTLLGASDLQCADSLHIPISSALQEL